MKKCPCCGSPVFGDYDWRSRPPTPEEVEAHDGMWLWEDEDGVVELENNLEVRQNTVFRVVHDPWTIDEFITCFKIKRWRPVTRDLYPYAWPVVEG